LKGDIAWKACHRQRKLFHLRRLLNPDSIGHINNLSKENNEYVHLLNHKVLQLNTYIMWNFHRKKSKASKQFGMFLQLVAVIRPQLGSKSGWEGKVISKVWSGCFSTTKDRSLQR
jgi:hypothetical protein